MIRSDKYTQALIALQQVLVRARFLAQTREHLDKLAGLLDAAEYLPQLIVDPADRTAEYAAWIEEIAERYPYCRQIYIEFNRQLPT